MTKNVLRPKHIHVTKGTNAVELRFENFDMLRRWLNLNNLDHGVDGLPVWLEPESEAVTLASTNSSITAAIVGLQFILASLSRFHSILDASLEFFFVFTECLRKNFCFICFLIHRRK